KDMSDTDAPRTSADDVHGGPEARPSGDGPIRFAAVIPRDAPVGEWPVRLHFRSEEDLARLLNRRTAVQVGPESGPAGITPASSSSHLTARQVADQLNVTVETVREWIKAGELVATRLGPTGRGRIYTVARDDLEAFLRQRRVGARPAPSVDAEAEQILQTLRK
ncbi:MAG: helix-turn-helix domain-containing protein, partial [Polyangiaceae bacterium]|nr:helix-turn-helix domain-containing protein [Polyangiaceae bacterium]